MFLIENVRSIDFKNACRPIDRQIVCTQKDRRQLHSNMDDAVEMDL